MTLKKMRFVAHQLLLGLLIAGLLFPPTLLAQSIEPDAPDHRGSSPFDTEYPQIDDFLRRLNGTPPDAIGLTVLDNHFLKHQFHRVFRLVRQGDQWVEEMEREVPLDQFHTSNPIVSIADFNREMRIVYDERAKELRFERVVYNDKAKRDVVTNAHVLKGVELTTKTGSHVLKDENLVLFSTVRGLRGILWPLAADLLFKAPLPSPLLHVAPGKLFPGARTTEMEFATPESHVRALHTTDGASSLRVGERDLMLQVQIPTDTGKPDVTVHVQIDYQKELIQPMAVRMLMLLQQLQVANPDLQEADVATSVLREHIDTLQAFQRREEAVLDLKPGEGSDLQRYALENLARHLPNGTLRDLLRRDPETGQNEFDRVAQAPRHSWQGGFSAGNEWMRAWTRIQEVQRAHGKLAEEIKARDPKAKLPATPRWQDILAADILNPGSETNATLEAAQAQLKKVAQTQTDGILQTVRRFATPERLKVLAMFLVPAGVALTVDFINLETDGAITRAALSTMSYMFSWTLDVPALGTLTAQIAESAEFYQTKFALTRVGAGVAAVLSLRHLGVIAAQAYAKLRGYSWERARAFFTLGARLYARANYPLQKLFLEKLLRQHNLYQALDNTIPLSARGVWNTPWATKETIEANARHLDQHLHSESIRRQRAMVIAAAAVSEAQNAEGAPIDPVTLMEMLTASQDRRVGVFLQGLGSIESEVAWSEHLIRTYRALSRLSDKGIGELDEVTIAEYTETLQQIAREYQQACTRQDNVGHNARRWVANKWRAFRQLTSRNIIPFVLFGKPGYDIFRRYKDVVITQRNAETAHSMFKVDYDFSAVLYAAGDPTAFSGFADGKIPLIARIGADQTEQVFIYGVQMGVDITETNRPSKGLSVPFSPLSEAVFARDKLASQGGGGLTQNSVGGLADIASDATNPASDRSVFETHRRIMNNMLTGFQVRFLAGLIPRAIGLGIIALATAGLANLAGVGPDVLSSIPKQMNVMFNKLAVLYGPGGFAVGYATIWSAIIVSMNAMKDAAEAGRARLSRIDYLLTDAGIRARDIDKTREGVGELLDLYRERQARLPDRFRRPSAEYDFDLAWELALFSRANPPLPTLHNRLLGDGLNLVGAIVSTMLYISLSRAMYDPDAPIMPQLTKSLSFFALTYLGMGVARPVAARVSRATAPIVRPIGGVAVRAGRTVRRKVRESAAVCKRLLRIGNQAGGE